MSTVWPPEVADKIRHRLERVHITGPLRTLTQDIAFGIDQLVEIAIRALSPAVNDTFTAMTCIDWLGDSLCRRAPNRPRNGPPCRLVAAVRVAHGHAAHHEVVMHDWPAPGAGFEDGRAAVV
jgi:hypothetical protein